MNRRRKVASVYVNLEKSCTVVDGPNPEDEYQDWSYSRCGKRVGGWQVFVSYDDIRESVVLEKSQVSTNLDLWSINGAPSSLGPKFEFRTRNGQPYAAVMRHVLNVTQDSGDIVRTSKLMVAKLSPKPCIGAAT
jgi:hypothetical protein